MHKRSETNCKTSLNKPQAACLTKCACIPQRLTLFTNHCTFLYSFVGMGVFVYLVLAISVYVLEILEGLDCVYVLSALLGNTF